MDKEERLGLIRRGNELFNNGDIKNALKIFLATEYQDGIVRVADHLYYEEKNQLSAIKLYKKAGYQRRVEEFAEKAAMTIKLWLDEDKAAPAEEVTISLEDIASENHKAEQHSDKNKKRFKDWKPKNLSSVEIENAGLSKKRSNNDSAGDKSSDKRGD